MENDKETICGEETLFNQEKIGDVQGESFPQQFNGLKQKKNLKDDQEKV